jgi:hypothetical protein
MITAATLKGNGIGHARCLIVLPPVAQHRPCHQGPGYGQNPKDRCIP